MANHFVTQMAFVRAGPRRVNRQWSNHFVTHLYHFVTHSNHFVTHSNHFVTYLEPFCDTFGPALALAPTLALALALTLALALALAKGPRTTGPS